MFVDFFYQLRHARIPVTIREFLMLLEAMEKGAAGISVEEFYVLARAAMIKDEKFFDTYDKVFGNFFRGAMNATESLFDKAIEHRGVREGTDDYFQFENIIRWMLDPVDPVKTVMLRANPPGSPVASQSSQSS